MTFKPINNQALDIKKERGKPHTGIYNGKTEIQTKLGPQQIYNFTDTEGVPFAVYGFTNLNRSMNGVTAGSLVRITYTGTINCETKFGKKDVHQVLVELDDGETTEPVETEPE